MGVRVVVRVERSLRERDVAGLAHEAAELRGGHRPLVHPEAVDPDGPHGALVRVEVLGAHEELPAGDGDHARRRRRRGRHPCRFCRGPSGRASCAWPGRGSRG